PARPALLHSFPTRRSSDLVVLDAHGGRVRVEISSVPLTEHHRIVGVFGQVVEVAEAAVDPPPPHLTPRQAEVLRLLQRGASTDQDRKSTRLNSSHEWISYA